MSYTYIFYKHIMFRHSCGKCHFTNTRRPSDLTLADFWGWEKTDKNFNTDDKGVSLLFVNTPKGKLIFEAIKDKLHTIPVKIDDCLQPNLCHPTTIHPQRIEFEEDFKKKGFKYVYYKYGEDGWRYKAKKAFNIIRYTSTSIIKRIIKTFVK